MATTAETPKLPFHLRDNYAPVFDEVEAFDLDIVGALPPELTGRYFRNGANPHTGKSPHWFAGDGMIHGIRLNNGKAEWYRNRYVQTRALTDPDAQMMGKDGTVDYTVGVNNTHIIRHADRILALVESSFPCELSPELETLGVHDYDGRLDSAMTAHPKECPITGELHFFGYGFMPPYLRYHRVSAEGELIQSETIDVGAASMIHDFSITENHVIFMDLPVLFDIEIAMRGGMPYAWDDDYGARVGVMPRGGSGSEVRWFEVDPCYVFHPLNSFEQGNTIVMDTARYPEMWRKTSAVFKNDAALHRWELDLDGGGVTETALDDRSIEFPRVADDKVGLPNRFGYSVASFDETNAIVKYDLESGGSTVHDFGTEAIPGEAVFVPAADGTAEDDGYLLQYVYDKTRDMSDFVVLDANDIAADPIATIALPQRIPFGFHGSWFAD